MTRRPRATWAATVCNAAVSILGPHAATAWLSRPNAKLRGLTPRCLAGDRAGADIVLAELRRMSVYDKLGRPTGKSATF